MSDKKRFEEDEAKRLWRWLALDYAEINYLAPKTGGRSDVYFAENEAEFIELCRDCPEDKLLVVGVNPRPNGLTCFGKEDDIDVLKNFYLDIEVNRSREAVSRINRHG